jgi:hypothetical protein
MLVNPHNIITSLLLTAGKVKHFCFSYVQRQLHMHHRRELWHCSHEVQTQGEIKYSYVVISIFVSVLKSHGFGTSDPSDFRSDSGSDLVRSQ